MAKKKHNKISYVKFDKLVGGIKIEPEVITYDINGEKIEIKVNPCISLTKRAQLVNDIADSVFADGVYAPYMLDFAYGYYLLRYYTDLYLPNDVDKINTLLNLTDIRDRVLDIIDDYSIFRCAQDLITYRKSAFLKHSKSDELVDGLISLVNNLDQIAEKGLEEVNVSEIIQVAKNLAAKDEKVITDAILDFQEKKDKTE